MHIIFILSTVFFLAYLAYLGYFLTTAISENSDVGTFVAMVTALDYDKPGTEHSEIKYSIEDLTTLFTIEPLTGNKKYQSLKRNLF